MPPVKGSPTPPMESPVEKIDPNDPRVKKLVYTLYRGMLTSENDKANGIMKTKDPKTVTQSQGVDPILKTLLSKERRRSDEELPSTQGPTLTFESLHPQRTNVADSSGPFSPIRRVGWSSRAEASKQLEPPRAIANSVLKEKKPFTYTPSGFALNTAPITTPNYTTRLTHNGPSLVSKSKPTPSAINGTGFMSTATSSNTMAQHHQRQQPALSNGQIPPPPPMIKNNTRSVLTTTTTTSSSYIMSQETTTTKINNQINHINSSSSNRQLMQSVQNEKSALMSKANGLNGFNGHNNGITNGQSIGLSNGQSNSLSNGGGSKVNWRDPNNLSSQTKMMKQLEIETMKRFQQRQFESAEIPTKKTNGTKVNGVNSLNFARMNLSK